LVPQAAVSRYLFLQKIARAYEVLTKKQQRVEYDFMRYNQEAYFQKYGASVLWNYAPQSDATMIILVLLLAINWFSWIAQKTRWQNVADRLVKAAVEDWSPSMGGSDESKQLKDKALVILKEKEVANGNNDDEASSTTADKKTGKGKVKKEKGQVKVSGKEKKKLEQDALRPIVTELVSEIDDFGAGFHKPTWRDLFLVKLSKFPYHLATGLAWQAKYSIRRLQKKELTDEERNVLTERAVGNVGWDLASDDERKEMVKRKLWIKDNLIEWKDEQEFQKLSKADQKYYNKMKKKGVSKDHTE
jgi:DnaJ family protein C protein 25